jgi:hypothetical protein
LVQIRQPAPPLPDDLRLEAALTVRGTAIGTFPQAWVPTAFDP